MILTMSRAEACTVPDQLLYSELPEIQGQHWIRLLCLSPGVEQEPISCDFSEHSLDDAPPYRALSYAWVNEHYVWNEEQDDSAKIVQRFITCNDREILVGANLHLALHRLRGPHQPRFIWVDAICINQKNPQERTQQVLRMKDVYSRSAEVVIWLGGKADMDDMGDEFSVSSGRTTVDFFGDYRDKQKLDFFLAREDRRKIPGVRRDVFGAFCILSLLANGLNASQIEQIRKQTYPAHIVKGLQAITEQSWWHRSWVIQETVVATDAVVWYDNISAPWHMFARAASTYQLENLNTNVESVYSYFGQLTRLSQLVNEIETARTMWWDERQLVTLPSLLRIFRPKGATDPRDKIFAFLGLVQSWESVPHGIMPDYSLAVGDVFLQTTIMLLKLTQSLSVLSGTLCREPSSHMPSWTVDWSSKPDLYETVRLTNAHHYNAASGRSRGDIRLHLGRILEIKGLEVDKVAFVAGESLPLDVEGLGQQWRFVIDDWERLAGGPSGGFWRTLCGDLEYGPDRQLGGEFCRVTDAQWETYASWRDADRFLRKSYRFSVHGIISLRMDSNARKLERSQDTQAKHVFQYSVECASGGRRFFVTSKGRLGTGPPDTKKGDSIAIVEGSRVPWILRTTDSIVACRCRPEILISRCSPGTVFAGAGRCNPDRRYSFRLVGDAYVQGIMDGEIEDPTMQPIFIE
ncbi:heterokaryon incompatibility protein [Colletotrichum kahawae]|uniref:Heterokaryon incompatibility protein n=1 Tax=Colletotrichum kahawae TaxID=34407 RepID=A0AAD9YR79_COLKA|nr:heterokaryon incompatibility protein [Colletotrichum kahawae]